MHPRRRHRPGKYQHKAKEAPEEREEKKYVCPACGHVKTLIIRRDPPDREWPPKFPPVAGYCPNRDGLLVVVERAAFIREQMLAEKAKDVMEENNKEE